MVNEEQDTQRRREMIDRIKYVLSPLNYGLDVSAPDNERDLPGADENLDKEDVNHGAMAEDSRKEVGHGASLPAIEGAAPLTNGQPELQPISLALTPTCDKARVESLRNEFYAELSQKHIPFWHDKKLTVQDLGPHAVGITNFFFEDMMGPKALLRSADLVKKCKTTSGETLDEDLATRAAYLEQNDGLPEGVRHFFGTFSKAVLIRKGHIRQYRSIKQMTFYVELLREYQALTERAKNADKDLIEHLEREGYVTTRGRGYRTCIVNYLAKCLGLGISKFKDICQTAKGIKELMEYTGPGILAILPVNAMNVYVSLPLALDLNPR